jgi:hypothetical protein
MDAIASPEASAASEADDAAADADLSDLFATEVPANGADVDFLDEATSATEAADAIDDVDLLFEEDTDNATDSTDSDFDDLLGNTVHTAGAEPTVAAPDADESVDDFDLTFADDSDETLAVDSDADRDRFGRRSVGDDCA